MRAADEVTTRLLCLAAVVTRANAEELFNSGLSSPLIVELTGAEASQVPSELNQWLLQERLTQELSPQERRWMKIPIGRWSERDILDAWWRREGLLVLLWSMQVIDSLPDADTQLNLDDLLRSACLLKDTREFRRTTKLRNSDEINKARDIAELWLWRARTTQLQDSDKSSSEPGMSKNELQLIVRLAAEAGERDGMFKCTRGDFPCFGKSFSELSADEWSLIHSISIERRYALNWLCHGAEWDDVKTDT